MSKNFGAENWQEYIPVPICEAHPEYKEIYDFAWKLAFDHIKSIDGMPQNPYMDEAFCATQVWIWDTCFMSLFCKYARDVFPGVETFKNFYSVLYEGGHLPTITTPEDEPSWTTAIPGEPFEIKVHLADNPPLFAWAEYENALLSGDKDYVKRLLYKDQNLQRHYEWFESLTEHTKPRGVLNPAHLIAEELGYKWEGGCSGMDNTPRGRNEVYNNWERPNNPNMYWIDAICQQALSANSIAKLFAIIGDSQNEQVWKEKFNQKKDIINKYYWDNSDKFYYDIDCNTHEHYKTKSIASYWTLTSQTATNEQGEILKDHLLNKETFGGFLPFVSVARNDGEFYNSGKYWRGSIWLPTAYAALKGIANYGFFGTAHSTAKTLLEHMYNTYMQFEPHTIWECYNPTEYKPATTATDGEYVRPDFCGWSALGPISVYIEYVLGFHTIDAFNGIVKWEKPTEFEGKLGIKNLRFGEVVTDIVANGNEITVITNKPYTLEINGKAYDIATGENKFAI